MYEYAAELIRVVDGDTVRLRVDLGFRITFEDNFRLSGFDAPESYRPKSSDERERGKAATESLREILSMGVLTIKSEKHGKYRWLARLYVAGPEGIIDVTDRMVALGHVK